MTASHRANTAVLFAEDLENARSWFIADQDPRGEELQKKKKGGVALSSGSAKVAVAIILGLIVLVV